VHGSEDVLIGRIAPVVGDEVISPYRGEIAKRFNRASRGAKPGMPVHAETPKMAVGVDDRSAIKSGHAQKLHGSAVVRNDRRVGTRLALWLPRTVSPFGPVMQRLLRRPRSPPLILHICSHLCSQCPTR
jgi:hypothetical protein